MIGETVERVLPTSSETRREIIAPAVPEPGRPNYVRTA